MKEPYLGSVRFFKNLILLAVLLAITVPSVLAFRFYGALSSPPSPAPPAADSAAPDGTNAGRIDIPNVSAPPSESVIAADTSTPLSTLAADPAVSAADTPAYTELYADFYAQKPLSADQSSPKTAFLTFDDGPSPRTDEILKILKEKNVKATFFVVGKTDADSIRRMKAVVADGHTLGMHSYSHNYAKIYDSVEAYLADMYQIFCLIRDQVGVTPAVFRLPGGSINGYDFGIYQQILAEMLRRGFVPCDWNVSSEDAAGGNPSAAQLVQNVVNGAKTDRRAFVLMHDAAAKKTTVSALPGMIDGLRAEGYTLLPFTEDVKPVLFGYTN